MSATDAACLRTPEQQIELYRVMATIREFEEFAYRAYEAGDVTGTVHASIGQEAVAAGVISALRREDGVFTHHRGHGHALAKGVDATRLFAELLGRGGGVSGGKGGSMHATDAGVGFLGSYALVGGSIPLAVGAALAARRRGLDTVIVAIFGDGAANQGILYESMNLAAIWALPVIFVCENNGYAISVPHHYAMGGDGVVARARAFGLRAEQVDGQSALDVAEVSDDLVAGAREGRPALLEAVTYRLVGHSRGDPPHGLYRTEEEVERWRLRDPLAVHVAATGMDEEQAAAIRAEARAEMQAALAGARAIPEPEPAAVESEIWG
jgi:TPP-dependent pyruvate/acetoin dehydrogenase alpha subunit